MSGVANQMAGAAASRVAEDPAVRAAARDAARDAVVTGAQNVFAVDPPAEDESRWRARWARFVLMMGFICAGLIILNSVLGLMTFEFGIPGIFLHIYMIVFGFVVFLAEIRRFKIFRSMIYHIIKFVYFLTQPIARALAYLFMGVLILNTRPLSIICAIVVMGWALVLIGVQCIVGLPTYLDWQVVKEEQEEAERAQVGNLRVSDPPKFDEKPTGKTQFNQAGYVPPALPPSDREGEAVFVPPVRSTPTIDHGPSLEEQYYGVATEKEDRSNPFKDE